MKSFAVIALAATAALAQNSPPAGCQSSTSGTFNIATVNVTRSAAKRDLVSPAFWYFDFDPQGWYPQGPGRPPGSTGFSLCSNSSLALSASGRASLAVFYQCLSGTFYNLYSQSTGAQCLPIYITAVQQGGGASQIPDGQPQVTQPPRVSQISDGQPQATSPRPASTPRPVISQISDGQPQVGTPRPVVSQISDGQPQVGTPRPVVSQISDGQPQVGTPRPVVSQIFDGQPQVGTPRPVVSQISDGQPQAPVQTGNATRPSATRPAPSQFTGAAASGMAPAGALVAGLFGLFAML